MSLIVPVNKGVSYQKVEDILALRACLKRISNAALAIMQSQFFSGHHKISTLVAPQLTSSQRQV